MEQHIEEVIGPVLDSLLYIPSVFLSSAASEVMD